MSVGGTVDEAGVVAGEVKYRALTLRCARMTVKDKGFKNHNMKVTEAVKVCRGYKPMIGGKERCVTLKAAASLAGRMSWLAGESPENCGRIAS